MENSPPHTKRAPPQTFELAKLGEKSPRILAKTFFFFFFFFFGDHLILGGKNVWILEFGRKITLNFGEDLFFFILFFIFWRSPNFGRKKRLNFGFRPKNHSEFWRRPFFLFFGDHLILGGKNLWISDLSETFRLKFRTNHLKLIQGQWKFESTSFAHFSLFQNSPPLFQILATRLRCPYCADLKVSIKYYLIHKSEKQQPQQKTSNRSFKTF